MNLAEVEQDWLARHLGHDIRIHREFYRQHESIIELSKISKILIASENGLTHKYKGKTVEDIPAEDLLSADENSDDEQDEQENDEDKDNESSNEKQSLSKRKRSSPEETKKKPKTDKKYLLPEEDDSDFKPDEDEEEDEADETFGEKQSLSKRKKSNVEKSKKKPKQEMKSIDLEQRTKLFNFFEEEINNLIIPRKKEIEIFKKENKMNLDWRIYKDIINARVQREKKKRQS